MIGRFPSPLAKLETCNEGAGWAIVTKIRFGSQGVKEALLSAMDAANLWAANGFHELSDLLILVFGSNKEEGSEYGGD